MQVHTQASLSASTTVRSFVGTARTVAPCPLLFPLKYTVSIGLGFKDLHTQLPREGVIRFKGAHIGVCIAFRRLGCAWMLLASEKLPPNVQDLLCWILSATDCLHILVCLRLRIRASRSEAYSAVDCSQFMAITSSRTQRVKLKLLVRHYECKTSLRWMQYSTKKLPRFNFFKLNRMFVKMKLTQLLKPCHGNVQSDPSRRLTCCQHTGIWKRDHDEVG